MIILCLKEENSYLKTIYAYMWLLESSTKLIKKKQVGHSVIYNEGSLMCNCLKNLNVF